MKCYVHWKNNLSTGKDWYIHWKEDSGEENWDYSGKQNWAWEGNKNLIEVDKAVISLLEFFRLRPDMFGKSVVTVELENGIIVPAELFV